MGFDAAAYAAAKKYVDETAQGLGAVKGSPCTIKSITETDDGATVVFSWTGADGVEQTSSTFLPRGPQGLPGEKGEPGAPGKDGSGTVDTVAREQITALTEEKADKLDVLSYGLPNIAVTGDTTGESKDNAVTMSFAYGDRTGNVERKWQGSSSLMWPKKNFTFKFDEAFEVVPGWGAQKKYCFKANFIDHSHARNLISAKLWGEIVKSRTMIGGVNGAVIASNSKDVSYAVTVSGNEITVKVTNAKHGPILFTGVTYPAGTHTITFEVFNPYTVDDNGSFSELSYGVPGEKGTDYYVKNINTVEAYGVWLPRTATVDFPADGSMIGFNIYSFNDSAENENPTKGYIFRNIKVDGVSYPLVPDLLKLKDLPNGGAVDGFPCTITENGKFLGLYTWNIPKDGWMFGMEDGDVQQAILCADSQNDACGFKAPATLTDDFELEYVSDEDNADWVATSLNTLINACMNSDGTDLDTTVAQYLDWGSAIDYYIFTTMLGGNDMVRKNYLLATYDGTKWFFSAYDMDTTYGLNWKGDGFNSSKGYPTMGDYNHRVMELINAHKKDELKARYTQLRNTVLSEDNLYLMFSNWASGIPRTILEEDARKWPTIPSTAISNTAQILNWYRMRCAMMDKIVNSWQ